MRAPRPGTASVCAARRSFQRARRGRLERPPAKLVGRPPRLLSANVTSPRLTPASVCPAARATSTPPFGRGEGDVAYRCRWRR